MKFVMSYSCGKDSTLALHKLIEQGHEPVGILVMINESLERSWFHGADFKLLEKYSNALQIPLIPCPSEGGDYHMALEEGLKKAKEAGAEMAGFGDIDLEGNRRWCEERCEHVGLQATFPLWQRERKDIVREIMETGYTCIIKSIHNEFLPKELLGKSLNPETVAIMQERGIDICGENGEYHTITVDGPIFHTPVSYQKGERLDFGKISVIDIW